ncbi:MAG: OmpA family protein [Bacteroidota bacterium]|jgi:OOP family OmpA-OmpF porin|nr:OmpA family protein [Cytophagales bacterium]MCE2956812.1 OmpA family protein [Flammeovirgaceae bacterium]
MKQTFFLFFCLSLSNLFAQEISPRYELVKLSDNVNSRYNEVSPVVSPDGKSLYFFVANHPENTFGKEGSQDIWVSSLDDKGQWTKATHLGAPFNQNRFNQVFNFLPDGSLFVRGGRAKNSKGFSVVSPGGSWNELKVTDFEIMDKGVFNGGTLSADGKQMILYFAEKEKEKFSDLYLSSKQPDGHFSKPVKLKISSIADDYAPFIAPDQKTLYFASNRFTKDRVGASDIYKVTRLDDSWANWSEPINLGRAINTPSEDAYFSIDEHGNIFTARAGNVVDGGNFDLLVLKPRNIRITLAGNVFSQKTQQPLVAALEVKIKDQKPINLKSTPAGKFETKIPETNLYTLTAAATGYLPFTQDYKVPKINRDTTLHVDVYLTPIAKQLVLAGDVMDKKTNANVLNSKLGIVLKSDRSVDFKLNPTNGKYQQEIPGLGWYLFTASAEGYLNTTDSVQVDNLEITPVVKNIFLTPIEVGITVRLKNIYFDFDRTTLKPESFVELNKVVDFLNQNPKVSIEIAGHTDAKGSDTYNENLSQGRSQSVVDYLVSQGIDRGRLQAHGYGESKPIDSNETEEGRANNRRVEFTVLKM